MKTTAIPTPDHLRHNPESTGLRHVRSASRRGYTSRNGRGYVEPYTGRYGKGFILVSPRFDTTRYVNIDYYVEA